MAGLFAMIPVGSTTTFVTATSAATRVKLLFGRLRALHDSAYADAEAPVEARSFEVSQLCQIWIFCAHRGHDSFEMKTSPFTLKCRGSHAWSADETDKAALASSGVDDLFARSLLSSNCAAAARHSDRDDVFETLVPPIARAIDASSELAWNVHPVQMRNREASHPGFGTALESKSLSKEYADAKFRIHRFPPTNDDRRSRRGRV